MNPAFDIVESKLHERPRDELVSIILHMRTAVRSRDAEIKELTKRVEWYNRQLFGPTSEKRVIYDENAGLDQPDLFTQAGIDPLPTPPSSEDETGTLVKSHTRRKGRKERGQAVNDAGLRFDDDVPVETVVLEPDCIDDIPEDRREKIDERVVYKIAQERITSKIIKYVAPVYRDKDKNRFVRAKVPSVFEGTCVDVSFLAGMLTNKFIWHLPLYRQHQQLTAGGIHISRSSLKNWTSRSISMLHPVLEAQWKSVLESDMIAMDETYIRAGRKSPGKMHRGLLWPVMGDRSELVFRYTHGRGHKNVEDILGDYQGTLLTDGYAGYSAYCKAREPLVSHALCWSHARRKFEQCLGSDPAAANRALDLIAALYQADKKCRMNGRTGVQLLTARRECLTPLMEEFWEWFDKEDGVYRLPKDPFRRALNYAGERRSGLQLCLTDPDIPLDNNSVERLVKHFATGRKNWLFAFTEAGAQEIAVIQSLLLTCRLQEVDPWTWLVDVLQRVDEHPARRVAELTPRLWKDKFADNPLAPIWVKKSNN